MPVPALEGKVALTAGGDTGIGGATAELFGQEGARVVVFGRRPEPLAETVDAIVKAGGVATAGSGDVGGEADVARVVGTARAQYGGGGCLGNCAAGGPPAGLPRRGAAEFVGGI